MWGDSGPLGSIPPRYTTRSTPARLHAATKFPAARRSRASKLLVPASIECTR